MKQNGIDRCTFVVAKEEGKTATCREHLFCKICQNCHKHCLEHIGVKRQFLDWAQNKKAVIL